ncbi:N-terminal C2 in EEIG1 and EHBP1 proteins-domain-containing protein [Whalleya microplaca]|nr:N-terminal C2 in EEIG1 and EHBP1 proteins-domain-containing protein [Whalleya microplaca]
MRVFPIVNKARKPKFELHLSIYDLNNVPLVTGTSLVKWHLPNSMHGEHRGRTAKCSIDKINHRVSYNYSKIVPLRISIDRANNLTECPVEFEVLQEFPMMQGARDEKISLGVVRLNLSEYVEESENFPRRGNNNMAPRASASLDHPRDTNKVPPPLPPPGPSHRRLSSSRSIERPGTSPVGNTTAGGLGVTTTITASHAATEENDVVDEEAEEGIVRRYLMQESKINSTLKIGILMVQIDGERNYVAPPLKTAPMFGGIAGVMTTGDTGGAAPTDPLMAPGEDGLGGSGSGRGLPPNYLPPNLNKSSRDASELQDMYRRSLAASWASQPGELAADECIEDIFSGGDGWNSQNSSTHGSDPAHRRVRIHRSHPSSETGSPDSRARSHHSNDGASASADASGDEGTTTSAGIGAGGAGGGTLKPSDMRRVRAHLRSHSGASDHSASTLTARHGHGHESQHRHHRSKPDSSSSGGGGVDGGGDLRSRSGSLTSLAPTLGSSDRGSERGREGFRRPTEVDEYEERDDLVAWTLPGSVDVRLES